MPHNHSPRCCCEPTYNGAIVTSTANCPSCIEHGELATLGNNAPIPSAAAGHCHGPGCDRDYDQRPSPGCPTPGVHDDPTPQPADTDAWLAAQPAVLAEQRTRLAALECPSCHTTNGHPHTDYCHVPIDPASVPYGTEIGTYRAMGDPVRWVKHWATQTSQPAATTSQPPTHTRSDHFTELEHSVTWGNRTTTHLRALCHPALCGQQPTPSQ